MRMEREALIGHDLRYDPDNPVRVLGKLFGGSGTGGSTDQPPYPPSPGYMWIREPKREYTADADGSNGRWETVDVWQQVQIPSSGGGGNAPTVAGAPYITEMGGRQVLVQDTNYGPQVISSWDSPSAQSYLSPQAPAGYMAIRDAAGNVVDYKADPDYINPYTKEQDKWANYYRDLGIIETRKQRNVENEQWGQTYEQQAARDAEAVRQFDLDLKQRIDANAATIAQNKAELAENQRQFDVATGVRKQELAATIQNNAAQIRVAEQRLANDMAIAQMDNATKLKIADMEYNLGIRGQNVTQRGQDIEAGVTTRGQNITREGNIMQSRAGLSQYAATLDPVAQAQLLIGGAGLTPKDVAMEEWRRSIPAMPAIKDFVLPAKIPGMAGGGTVMNTTPQMRLVGERGPELMAVYPDRTDIIPLSSIRGAAEGDSVATPAAPPALPTGFTSWAGVLAELQRLVAKKAGSKGYGSAGLYNLLKKLPRELRALPVTDVLAKINEWVTAPVASTPPPSSPPPVVTPEDTILPGTYDNAADLEAARQTMRDQLTRITQGAPQRYDYNLEPVYGVDIGRPQDYAYSFPKMASGVKDVLTGAFNLRNISPETFEETRRKFVPAALSPRVISWG